MTAQFLSPRILMTIQWGSAGKHHGEATLPVTPYPPRPWPHSPLLSLPKAFGAGTQCFPTCFNNNSYVVYWALMMYPLCQRRLWKKEQKAKCQHLTHVPDVNPEGECFLFLRGGTCHVCHLSQSYTSSKRQSWGLNQLRLVPKLLSMGQNCKRKNHPDDDSHSNLHHVLLGENAWAASGIRFSLALKKGLKMQGPVQNTQVTFPFWCIPNTHVLPSRSRGCNILAEAAAYDLSSPSTSAWKVRKILCERFFSLKASLRELAIFRGKARLVKANTHWVYFSSVWCNTNNNNIF